MSLSGEECTRLIPASMDGLPLTRVMMRRILLLREMVRVLPAHHADLLRAAHDQALWPEESAREDREEDA